MKKDQFGMITFNVTQQHIDLLRNAVVGWENCEFGAPAIDCKRPYGNSSVYDDIAEILGISKNMDDDWSDEQHAMMRRLHEETRTVLQIFLTTGAMIIGQYIGDQYNSRQWKRKE